MVDRVPLTVLTTKRLFQDGSPRNHMAPAWEFRAKSRVPLPREETSALVAFCLIANDTELLDASRFGLFGRGFGRLPFFIAA